MPFQFYKTKQIRLIFIVFWILLAYIIAALIWWFIALNHQNRQMTYYKIEQLDKTSSTYKEGMEKIRNIEKRKKAQYIGEGSIFLLLILAGGVYIFQSARNQFKSGLQQQHFMMAVTHELKTPIAVTKLNLETLVRHKLDEGQQNKLLLSTIQEANRLNTLCNNLLLTSQIEAGGYSVTKEESDISIIANECAADYITRFPQRNIISQIEAPVFLKVDKIMLQMAFNNLVDNAIKYSAKESTVTILLRRERKSVCFAVKDEGNGISSDEKKKIFEKFYRMGNTATKSAKGTGLGLYLTKKIAREHYASVFIEDNKPKGSIFTIRFKQDNNIL